MEYFALLMLMWRSSNGCRSTSRVVLLNSGSSSQKSTPLCANDISPGWGLVPPPTRATCEVVWWGVHKDVGTLPAGLCICFLDREYRCLSDLIEQGDKQSAANDGWFHVSLKKSKITCCHLAAGYFAGLRFRAFSLFNPDSICYDESVIEKSSYRW